MDNPWGIIAVLLIAALFAFTLDGASRAAQLQQRISRLQMALAERDAALESADIELATCKQDVEVLEVERDVLSQDLRRCDAFYAQREYAADANY